MNVALRPDALTFISLCTGGGGLDLGVELAIPCARPIVLVEREAFAVAHLVSAMEQGLLAPAPVWSDVRTFDGRPWRGLVDGVIGGIPCQPHSVAGKRLGQGDERDLWSSTRRIIAQSRPWFVLIENVGGMLSSGGAERLWRDLGRLGYAREVGLFAAAEVRATHERARLFVLAVADADRWRRTRGPARYPKPDDACEPSPALAYARYPDHERRREPGIIHGAESSPEETPDQRERNGHAACYGSEDVAHAASLGLGVRPGQKPEAEECGRSESSGGGSTCQTGYHGGCSRAAAGTITRERVDTSRIVRGTIDVDDTSIARGRGLSVQPGRSGEARPDIDGAGARLGDSLGRGHDGLAQVQIGDEVERSPAEWPSGDGDPGLSPPGPTDLDGWRRVLAHSPELEPAVRRMADDVALRVDLAGPHAARIERLRMLGNGVVTLQAAYAFRTLATRLARRSAAAAALVRMMEMES